MVRASRASTPTRSAAQALALERVEKGLVPAFACHHDPVLAKGSTGSNRSAKRDGNPGKRESYQRQGAAGGDPARARGGFRDSPRLEPHEILALLTAPLLDLVDQARAVHRRHHADGDGPAREPALDQDRGLPRGLQILPAIGALRQADRARARDAARRGRRAGQGAHRQGGGRHALLHGRGLARGEGRRRPSTACSTWCAACARSTWRLASRSAC